MAFPSRNAILRGFFFIIAVLIYLLCERWMKELKVVGTPIYQAHVFNHVFLLWTFKQCLLAGMYVLWKAIDQNWIGMRRFRHAEIDESERENQRRRTIRRIDRQDSTAPNGSVNGDGSGAATHPIRPIGSRRKTYTKLLFLLPSMFSQAHVILVYFGVQLTYPSSVIMLTGTAGMFVTILSLAFLAKQISSFMWIGVSMSLVGFAISGLSNYLIYIRGYEPYGIAAGGLLYTMSQMTITTQMVYEEKFMRKLSIHPMKFLGSEGIYSMVFSLIMLASFCLSDTQYSDLPNNRIEDIADAALQFANSWKVVLAVIGSIFSYVVYNYLGIILIKDHGAMSRVMIEALAWCFYWAILVSIGWERYYITQIPGLVLVPCGVLIFSHIVVCPCSCGNETVDPNDAETFNQTMAHDLDEDGDDRHAQANQNGNIINNNNDDAQLLRDGQDLPFIADQGDELLIQG